MPTGKDKKGGAEENADTKSAAEDEEKVKKRPVEIDEDFLEYIGDIYKDIVRPFPVSVGKAISKKERQELNLKETTLVYGELEFRPLALCFEKIKKKYGRPFIGASGPMGILQEAGGKFYDLGSGLGKGCVAAALLHNFEVCYGIEILEGLYSMSLDVVASYNSKGKAALDGRDFDTDIIMLNGDMLDPEFKDWSDADVVFANSTCYSDTFLEQICDMALALKKGAFVITFTKQLPSTDFEVLEYELHDMSWGAATVYIMQKITNPHLPDHHKEQSEHHDSDEDA